MPAVPTGYRWDTRTSNNKSIHARARMILARANQSPIKGVEIVSKKEDELQAKIDQLEGEKKELQVEKKALESAIAAGAGNPASKLEAQRDKREKEMKGEKVEVQAKVAMKEGVSVLPGEMFKIPKNRIPAVRDLINVPGEDKIDEKLKDEAAKIRANSDKAFKSPAQK